MKNVNKGPRIIYFTSEDPQGYEFKARLKNVGMDFDLLRKSNFEMKARAENFAEVIEPDSINIIDFLEIYKDFYLMGEILRNIFARLNKGIAVIAIQKDKNKDYGRGGVMVMEKPRLVVSLKSDFPYGQKAVIEKAKMFKGEKNPYNQRRNYHIVNGIDIVPTGEWNDGEEDSKKVA